MSCLVARAKRETRGERERETRGEREGRERKRERGRERNGYNKRRVVDIKSCKRYTIPPQQA